MRDRLAVLGNVSWVAILLVPGLALVVGVWLLGNVFYDHNIWFLGAVCRVASGLMGLAAGIMLLMFLVIVAQSLIKGRTDY